MAKRLHDNAFLMWTRVWIRNGKATITGADPAIPGTGVMLGVPVGSEALANVLAKSNTSFYTWVRVDFGPNYRKITLTCDDPEMVVEVPQECATRENLLALSNLLNEADQAVMA